MCRQLVDIVTPAVIFVDACYDLRIETRPRMRGPRYTHSDRKLVSPVAGIRYSYRTRPCGGNLIRNGIDDDLRGINRSTRCQGRELCIRGVLTYPVTCPHWSLLGFRIS